MLKSMRMVGTHPRISLAVLFKTKEDNELTSPLFISSIRSIIDCQTNTLSEKAI